MSIASVAFATIVGYRSPGSMLEHRSEEATTINQHLPLSPGHSFMRFVNSQSP